MHPDDPTILPFWLTTMLLSITLVRSNEPFDSDVHHPFYAPLAVRAIQFDVCHMIVIVYRLVGKILT